MAQNIVINLNISPKKCLIVHDSSHTILIRNMNLIINSMETTFKKNQTKGILTTFAFVMLTVCAKAQGSSNFFSKIYANLMKDSQASFFIIAGVVGIGLLAFFINKMANKNNKEDEKNGKNTTRSISHRHHHHHRIVKKSA
jgi:hypothetical protein